MITRLPVGLIDIRQGTKYTIDIQLIRHQGIYHTCLMGNRSLRGSGSTHDLGIHQYISVNYGGWFGSKLLTVISTNTDKHSDSILFCMINVSFTINCHPLPVLRRLLKNPIRLTSIRQPGTQ